MAEPIAEHPTTASTTSAGEIHVIINYLGEIANRPQKELTIPITYPTTARKVLSRVKHNARDSQGARVKNIVPVGTKDVFYFVSGVAAGTFEPCVPDAKIDAPTTVKLYCLQPKGTYHSLDKVGMNEPANCA